MASSGLGIIAMTLVAPAPVNTQYYAGLIMVVICGSTLVRLGFLNATIISLALVFFYQPVAMQFNPVAPETLIANNFFLVMATLIGIFVIISIPTGDYTRVLRTYSSISIQVPSGSDIWY